MILKKLVLKYRAFLASPEGKEILEEMGKQAEDMAVYYKDLDLSMFKKMEQ
jgi:hypothetical protein